METTRTDPTPDGRQAATTWVAGTGAFLLLAAAALFVAVRWDQLPDIGKLGVVVGLTGAFLAGGRALRGTLPVTGDALFHLGALLVPVDIAAVAVHLQLGWRQLLLAEGVVATAALGALAKTSGSVMLARAAGASVVVLSAGLAAVTPLPVGVLLVVAAVAAEAAGRPRASVPWAAVAGLAPILGAAVTALLDIGGTTAGAGVLTDLGLAGTAASYSAALVGLTAAYVVGRQARLQEDLALAYVAVACTAVGLGTAWAGADIGPDGDVVASGAVFLIIEVAALAFARDRFWRRPTEGLAIVAEVVSGLAVLGFAFGLLIAPLVFTFGDGHHIASAVGGFSAALAALGWLAAGLRNGADRTFGATGRLTWSSLQQQIRSAYLIPAFIAAAAAVQLGTGSSVATGAALVALAAGLAAARIPYGLGTAVAFSVWAPLVVFGRPVAGLLIGLASAAVAGETAVAAVRGNDRADLGGVTGDAGAGGGGDIFGLDAGMRFGRLTAGGRQWLAVASPLWGLAPLAALAITAGHAAGLATPLGVAAGAVAACWALAVQLDRGSPRLGDVARLGLVVPALGAAASGWAPGDLLAVTAVTLVVLAVEALRLDRPVIADGAALVVQLAVYAVAAAAGLDAAGAGVAMCVAALAWAGLAAAAEDPWREPFLVAAAAGASIGLALAAGDGSAFSGALIVVGALLVAAGVVRHPDPGWAMAAHAGGAFLIVGIAGQLAQAHVGAAEAYAAPAALHMLCAGWYARRPRAGRGNRPTVSSWAAYTPAIFLVGGVALAERIAGGVGWHALVAGVVGVAAVAAGGTWRLSGPLVVGTGLLVAITVHESLATLATVPTWGWLALGGSTLLAVGIVLERQGSSPAETGRRVVDVLAEQFS